MLLLVFAATVAAYLMPGWSRVGMSDGAKKGGERERPTGRERYRITLCTHSRDLTDILSITRRC